MASKNRSWRLAPLCDQWRPFSLCQVLRLLRNHQLAAAVLDLGRRLLQEATDALLQMSKLSSKAKAVRKIVFKKEQQRRFYFETIYLSPHNTKLFLESYFQTWGLGVSGKPWHAKTSICVQTGADGTASDSVMIRRQFQALNRKRSRGICEAELTSGSKSHTQVSLLFKP